MYIYIYIYILCWGYLVFMSYIITLFIIVANILIFLEKHLSLLGHTVYHMYILHFVDIIF